MNFGESVFSVGFIQKAVKVDQDVRYNCAYPQQNGHQKVLKDSRGLHTEAEGETPARPPRAHMSSPVVTSVLHRLLGCIYAIL